MMKKLLISTALVASLGFASGAFAQAAGTPVFNSGGDQLYTWTDANGNSVSGTAAEYTTYIGTLTVPSYTSGSTSYNGVTYGTASAALAAYEAAVAANDEALLGVTGSYTPLTVADNGNTNSLAGNQESLLASLLSQAQDIQSTLANTSENLANIDGSISIDLTRFGDQMDVNVGVTGVTIMEPLNATIGQLSTTVIGSLGNGTVDTTAVLSNIEAVNQAQTQTSDALNLQFGDAASNLGLQQVYNLSSNLGALDASVDVVMAGVNIDNLAGISTTAIGSLGTGSITSDLNHNAAALTNRLVGTQP